MSNEPVPVPASNSLQPWFSRLGLSGMLLLFGGVAGLISMALPLISVSMEMGSGMGNAMEMLGGKAAGMGMNFNVSKSVKVIENWRGVICLLGYLGAIVLSFVLFQVKPVNPRTLFWSGLAVGGLITLFAVWLLILSMDTGKIGAQGVGMIKASMGLGVFLNLLAGLAVLAGGFMKAKEEKLV